MEQQMFPISASLPAQHETCYNFENGNSGSPKASTSKIEPSENNSVIINEQCKDLLSTDFLCGFLTGLSCSACSLPETVPWLSQLNNHSSVCDSVPDVQLGSNNIKKKATTKYRGKRRRVKIGYSAKRKKRATPTPVSPLQSISEFCKKFMNMAEELGFSKKDTIERILQGDEQYVNQGVFNYVKFLQDIRCPEWLIDVIDIRQNEQYQTMSVAQNPTDTNTMAHDVTPSCSRYSQDDVSFVPATKRLRKVSETVIENSSVIIKEESLEQTSEEAKLVGTATRDYNALVKLADVNLVTNVETFECPICFTDIEPSDGVVLQECLHSFCKDCLSRAVELSETVVIKCPFHNGDYACEFFLTEREIKSLVTDEVFERHLQRSVSLAENQAENSFHCKTPDCPGWCFYEENVNTFWCPVCMHTNCLNCQAIHEEFNCKQFQDDLDSRKDTSKEAKKTRDCLDKMLRNGKAMRCPKCAIIVMKNQGCDALICSMCRTEICWATKGPRRGPGGCNCLQNGAMCHPSCKGCH